MRDGILALNAGSSSLKFGLYDIADGKLEPVARGTIGTGRSPRLVVKPTDRRPEIHRPFSGEGVADGIAELLDLIEQDFGARRLMACGHRIVHGGAAFSESIRLTPSAIDAVEALAPLAPLHQPRSIAPIRAVADLRPELPQVGCFDTGFHRTIGTPASRYALPRAYEEKGIRRYGFHGLSYEYIAGLLEREGRADRRVIVAHLGNGASLCAMQHGRSLDTTMGFSALDGLVMGTRCGAIDPGVLLYLLQHDGMTPHQVQDLLYRESGLLGVSGLSGDMRELERSHDPRAQEAVELFVFRIAREVAALANTLGGLESLIFTAGIGEHSAPVRLAVCQQLNWMGLAVDGDKNQRHGPIISSAGSRVEVSVVPTNEEIVIARHVLKMNGQNWQAFTRK